ncbi:beta-glucosidase, partial [Sarracenia purpurea var. burkii]
HERERRRYGRRIEPRFGIPVIYGTDTVHGDNDVYGVTIFPHGVGLGATDDADLAYKVGFATALEVCKVNHTKDNQSPFLQLAEIRSLHASNISWGREVLTKE